MKKNKIIFLSIAMVVLLIVVIQSAYVVKETEQVVITQFGKPVGEAKTEPGLKFKTPFIQKSNYFEKQFQFLTNSAQFANQQIFIAVFLSIMSWNTKKTGPLFRGPVLVCCEVMRLALTCPAGRFPRR